MGIPLITLAGKEHDNDSLDQKRKLLVFGSGNFKVFLKHILPFTKKETPKILFVPTATGDSLTSIANCMRPAKIFW